MTMILTNVTMVGCMDVLESDRGDFRCRHAIDISSCLHVVKQIHPQLHNKYKANSMAADDLATGGKASTPMIILMNSSSAIFLWHSWLTTLWDIITCCLRSQEQKGIT